MLKNDKTNLTILLILVLIVVAAMLPFREQTSGDDYTYALAVKHTVETGRFQISEATAAALVFLVAWGSLFANIFGFSLKTLHLSVVVFLPFLTFSIYFLLKELKIEKTKAFFFTILFISVPFIFQYTYTFLTDLPFLTLEVYSLVFYIKAFRKNNLLNFFIGSLFASVAFLTRQIGIIVWVSALLTFLIFLTNRDTRPSPLNIFKYLLTICAPMTITVILYRIFFKDPTIGQVSFFQNVVLTNFYHLFSIQAPLTLKISAWLELYYRAVEWFWLALGLFSPLAIIILASNPRVYLRTKQVKRAIIALVVFTMLIVLQSVLLPGKVYLGFPLVFYRYENLFPIPWPQIWKYLVLISFLFLGTYVNINRNSLHKVFQQIKTNSIYFFLCLSYLLIVVSTNLSGLFYYKYAMPMLPFYLVLFATVSRKLKIYVPVAILITVFVFIDSLQMTKLRYDENGLAQEKAIRLKNQGIAAERILPNLEYTWSLWFDMDTKYAKELKRVNGDKKRATIPVTPAGQDYIIISKEHLKYYKLPQKYILIETIPVHSLFVSSDLIVLKKL